MECFAFDLNTLWLMLGVLVGAWAIVQVCLALVKALIRGIVELMFPILGIIIGLLVLWVILF